LRILVLAMAGLVLAIHVLIRNNSESDGRQERVWA